MLVWGKAWDPWGGGGGEAGPPPYMKPCMHSRLASWLPSCMQMQKAKLQRKVEEEARRKEELEEKKRQELLQKKLRREERARKVAENQAALKMQREKRKLNKNEVRTLSHSQYQVRQESVFRNF